MVIYRLEPGLDKLALFEIATSYSGVSSGYWGTGSSYTVGGAECYLTNTTGTFYSISIFSSSTEACEGRVFSDLNENISSKSTSSFISNYLILLLYSLISE